MNKKYVGIEKRFLFGSMWNDIIRWSFKRLRCNNISECNYQGHKFYPVRITNAIISGCPKCKVGIMV